MEKIHRCFKTFRRIAGMMGIVFVVWRLARRWHAGAMEEAGHTIDETIAAAAGKVEKAAAELEVWANDGKGRQLGKEADILLTEAKNALDGAAELIQPFLKHA
jgi:hypothetical protein